MAKKPEAPAASPAQPERRTFNLSRPVPGKDGAPVGEIALEEPQLKHLIVAGRKSGIAETTISLLAQLTGLPEDSVKKIKTADARSIEAWLLSLASPDAPVVSDAGDATFQLSVPLVDGNKMISALTLREPDLECAIAVERMKTLEEQTAATIASLSGYTIPLISQLRVRDVRALEAWLGPFYEASTSAESEAGAP